MCGFFVVKKGRDAWKLIKVYDLNLDLVAYLENAFDVGYDKQYNNLWTAQFSLPSDDEKNVECTAFRFVEIFDGDQRVDLFRIIPSKLQKSSDGQTITYNCEHVLGTLLDDLMFAYHQVGGTGILTSQVLNYILGYQTLRRWTLGTCSFTRQFEYSWENDNLLASLYSVPNPFDTDYMWTWDTTTYPWTLNLVQSSTAVDAYIRYGVNLRGITKDSDPTNICTRLYCLGYGEGINQLNIASVNSGQPYLDADTQSQYGIITKIFTDRRYQFADTLKAAGQAILDQLKTPRLTYSVEAAELYRLTNDSIHKFNVGSLVRVIDEELGIDVISRVITVKKNDIYGAPGDVQIEIANKALDIAQSLADLQDRQRINEVYSQGATNLDSHDFADNADPSNPAIIKFYIPAETVQINKMILNYEVGAFRAYSKAIAGGGGTTQSTSSGGGTTATSSSGGGTNTTTAVGGSGSGTTSYTTGGSWLISGGYSIPDIMESKGLHNHGIPDHTMLSTSGGGSIEFVWSGSHAHGLVPHSHSYDLPSHAHSLTIPNHTHNVTISNHAHSVTIPDHTHDIQYGIFLRSPAPTSVTITVDGTNVPVTATSTSDLDIIQYLAKDTSGKVTRGAWHEIKITPNDLGRVVANVVTQLFVQSRGGGNY